MARAATKSSVLGATKVVQAQTPASAHTLVVTICRPPPPPYSKVQVVGLWQGKTCMVDTNLHLPASNLADAILERVGGIACDNYFTVYLQGRQLKGDKTLESSGVLEGTRIEVKWCGRGGMDGDGNCSGGKRSVPPTSLIDKASIMPAIEARMLVTRFFVNVVPGDTAAVLQYTPLFGTRFTQSHPNGTGF